MHTRLKQSIKALCALAIVGTLILIYLFTSGFGTPKSASADTEIERTGLGLSINAVKTTTLDLRELKDGSPIFNTTWLQTQKENANIVNVNSTTNKSYTTGKFQEIAESYNTKFSFNSSVTLGIDLFTAGISSGFEKCQNETFTEKMSQYYYIFNSQIDRYTLSLPNYSSDLSAYKANLNTNYLNALDKVFKGTMTYDTLFNTYGTHIIMKGIYGGNLHYFYRAASSTIDVGYTSSTVLTSSFNASIDKVLNVGYSTSYSAQQIYNCQSSEIFESSYVTANGGNPFTGVSFSDFSSHYASWANSVVSSPVLVSTSSDGLVPLWELLPAKYSSYQSAFKQAYTKYANNVNENVYGDYDAVDISNFNKEETIYDNRPDEYLIGDNNPHNNSHDILEFSDYLCFDLFKRAGFKTIKVKMRIEMKEKDNGNQNFYLVNDINADCENPIAHHQEKWGGIIKKKTYGYVDIDFGAFPIDKFKENRGSYNKFTPIVILYGSSGSGSNAWYNQNYSIEVKFCM